MNDTPVCPPDQARSLDPLINSRKTPTQGLADRLKSVTQGLHRDAERAGAVARLLRGTITRSAYVSLLRNILPAYQQIEHGLIRHRNHELLHRLAIPALYRTAAIEADLTALVGPNWSDTIALLPAGAAYAALVDHATTTAPALLIAHAYVRYLGDLNGGQMLQRRLATTLGLDHTSLAFYQFDDIPDLAAFRETYRTIIDTITPDDETTTAILAEAQAAFEANIAVSIGVGMACE